jgi:3-methyladenine DNA glycosylase AlkD
MNFKELQKELRKYANQAKAKILRSFFKTAPGEYGAGDSFLGVPVPRIREIIKEYKNLCLSDIGKLLNSSIHEERLSALLILVLQFHRADTSHKKKKIYNFYLENTKYINNWDLVDLTAPHILGAYLADKDKRIIYALAKSKNMWERRIAVVSTFYFIRNNQFNDTLSIAKNLLSDKEDLIHKAAGWMLREVGKRNISILENFLRKYYNRMPRTMLRYAIERFGQAKRKAYLEGRV